MAAKKLDDQQIQHCLDVLGALAQSGQSGKAFAQAQGMSYAQLREELRLHGTVIYDLSRQLEKLGVESNASSIESANLRDQLQSEKLRTAGYSINYRTCRRNKLRLVLNWISKVDSHSSGSDKFITI